MTRNLKAENTGRSRRRAPFALVFAVALSPAPCFGGAGQTGAEYESPDRVALDEILPPALLRSSNYELAGHARAEDNFYHFDVTTDHGRYQVASNSMLRIRLHEIATIVELSAKLGRVEPGLDRSPAGRRGVASEDVVDILANPIGTASQLLGNLQHNLGETFADPREADEDERTPRSSLDLNPDPHKRSAAAQLGVDVYSSNPHLQTLLDALASARSAGKSGVSISPLVHNKFAERPFGSGVFSQRMASLLKNTASPELNALVDAKLERLGMPADRRIAFITHPAYTPRTRLFLTAYLELLGNVDRLDALLAASNMAETEADALAYVNYLRMLAYYQLTNGDLDAVITQTRFPAVASARGVVVLALPLDYLAWTESVAQLAAALAETRDRSGLARALVLLSGAPTDRAFEELGDRDVEVRSHYSF